MADSQSEADAAAERELAWRAIEEDRATSDRDLRLAADEALAQDKARLTDSIEKLLREAWDGTTYKPINWDSLSADPSIYEGSLASPWALTWKSSAKGALPPEVGSTPTWADSDGPGQLAEGAGKMARTSRDQTSNIGQAMVAAGEPPSRILDEVRNASTWSTARADGIARTETVRAQSLGTDARYLVAQSEGVELEQEWLSARDSEVRDHHRALDGKRAPVGGEWTFPNGVTTRGPGLSGDASEDCNCRCAKRAVILR